MTKKRNTKKSLNKNESYYIIGDINRVEYCHTPFTMTQHLAATIRDMQKVRTADWVVKKIPYTDEEIREIMITASTFITTNVLLLPSCDAPAIVVIVFLRRENGNAYLDGLRSFYATAGSFKGVECVIQVDESIEKDGKLLCQHDLYTYGNCLWDLTNVPLHYREMAVDMLSKTNEPRIKCGIMTATGPEEFEIRKSCHILPELLCGEMGLAVLYDIYLKTSACSTP